MPMEHGLSLARPQVDESLTHVGRLDRPPALHTLLKVSVLKAFVSVRFAVGSIIDVKLLRRGRLEVYRIATQREMFAVRVYPSDTEGVRLECTLSMMALAARAGLAAGSPIRALDGNYAQPLESGIGIRWVSLHRFEELVRFESETTSMERLGRCIGGVHGLASGECDRSMLPRLDPVADLKRALDVLTERYKTYKRIGAVLERAGGQFLTFWARRNQTPRRVFCHGDLSRDNVVVVAGGRVALLGFRGYGLGDPAGDLAQIRAFVCPARRWSELVAGYAAVAPLDVSDLDAIAHFHLLSELVAAASLDRESARWGRTWEGYDLVDSIVARLLSSRFNVADFN